MSITVHTQEELDAAIAAKESTIYIESEAGVWLTLRESGSSHVIAWGSSHVDARGSSHVDARGSSHVDAWDSSHVDAWDSSHVDARGSSHVDARGSSHVIARGSSHVDAWDSSHVDAWGSSHVIAWGSSHVIARGSSHVDARGSSHVDAWDSSHVIARDSSHVIARDSSHVDARGSSHVIARGSSHVDAGKFVGVHLHSQRVTLDAKGAVIDMTAVDMSDPATWCEVRGVKVVDGIATVYKALNDQWSTPRGFDYSPGSTPEASDWEPTETCGQGLHFGVTPSHSAEYLEGATKFVRCGIRLDEVVPLGDKVKAKRVVTPCVEVDQYGVEVVAQ